jgi:hypothetical protein
MPFTCDVHEHFKKLPTTYVNAVFATALVSLTTKLASQLATSYHTFPICQTYKTAILYMTLIPTFCIALPPSGISPSTEYTIPKR